MSHQNITKKLFSSDKRGSSGMGFKPIQTSYLFILICKVWYQVEKENPPQFWLFKKNAFHSHLCHMDLWVSIWFSLEEFTELLTNVIDSLPFTLHDLSEENLIRLLDSFVREGCNLNPHGFLLCGLVRLDFSNF